MDLCSEYGKLHSEREAVDISKNVVHSQARQLLDGKFEIKIMLSDSTENDNQIIGLITDETPITFSRPHVTITVKKYKFDSMSYEIAYKSGSKNTGKNLSSIKLTADKNDVIIDD